MLRVSAFSIQAEAAGMTIQKGWPKMDLMQTSEEWGKSHFIVNDLLEQLLNELRNLGYNPSFHITYDHAEHHLLLDEALLNKHQQLANKYQEYLTACARRDEAVRTIQALPKIDLGFESQS
jgi:hypothetical protein